MKKVNWMDVFLLLPPLLCFVPQITIVVYRSIFEFTMPSRKWSTGADESFVLSIILSLLFERLVGLGGWR